MRAGPFDELDFFRSIQSSGARTLLIGRRAMVVLGLPVLTADYDFWIAIDDIAAFNRGSRESGSAAHEDTGGGAKDQPIRARKR